MQKKDWTTSTKGYWIDWYRQLAKIDRLLNRLENSNFIKKYFNRDAINLLKEQRKYVERSIVKHRELWVMKEDSRFSRPVENIIKENKSLSREITRWVSTNYLSKREANHWNQKKRWRGRPRKNLS